MAIRLTSTVLFIVSLFICNACGDGPLACATRLSAGDYVETVNAHTVAYAEYQKEQSSANCQELVQAIEEYKDMAEREKECIEDYQALIDELDEQRNDLPC